MQPCSDPDCHANAFRAAHTYVHTCPDGVAIVDAIWRAFPPAESISVAIGNAVSDAISDAHGDAHCIAYVYCPACYPNEYAANPRPDLYPDLHADDDPTADTAY